MKYAVEITSCSFIYLPSFMKIGTGVQAILRFASEILEAVMLVITDGRDFLIAPL
jgi:hypothetical protein